MLVGLQGSGKTTTTAKLAAAFATKHGAANLGLITLGGASLLDLIKSRHVLGQIGAVNMALGIGVSFVVAYASIGWLLKFVSTNDFKPFAIYRILAGIIILALIATGVLHNTNLA